MNSTPSLLAPRIADSLANSNPGVFRHVPNRVTALAGEAFAFFVLFLFFGEWFKLLSAFALVALHPHIFGVLFGFRIFGITVLAEFLMACSTAVLMNKPRDRKATGDKRNVATRRE